MENASNALLMAGGILIALLIIGALVIMGANLQSYQNNNDDLTKLSQIAEFNNQFEPYNKDNLTLMELKSIYNKIKSNNAQHPEHKIDHNIDGVLLASSGIEESDNIERFLNDTKGGFKKIDDQYKQNLKFNCQSQYIEHDTEGRITYMTFEVGK